MIKQQNAGTVRSSRRRAGTGRAALMLSAGTLAMVLAQPALAQVAPGTLPSGGTIVGGTGSIGSSGTDMTVTQTSDRLLINWGSFDIGSGATVHFDMDATDIAVNRDNAGDPSEIYGALSGDGMIMIMNPNGVLFGAGANVNVGSLVATTAGLTDVNAISGSMLNFSGAGGGTISIAAGATITVAEAGLAAFVAPGVSNQGIITATAGHVLLGGADGFTLDLANDGLLELTVPTASPLVQNHGSIFAEGGRIQMSAAAASALVGTVINTSGVLSVASASSDDGVIVLEAAGNDIEVSSDLSADGDITFSARRVHGAGDVDVADGALTLNIDPDGADTTGETLIADALGVIGAVDGGTTLNLAAGDYAAGAAINVANVTVDGGGAARIIADQNGQDGLTVHGTGDGAVIQGLTFIGQADTSYNGFAWGGTITRGVVLRNGAENVTVTDNVITGVRNGILIDGRNDGSIITDNVIDNTKSAISVQYTDGSNLTLTGNAEGVFGNEWGINVHLNGVWNGVAISPSAGSLGANPSAGAQQHLLDLSNANGGMSVYNQAYSASNRTHVHVDAGGSPSGQGAAPTPISTVHGGVAAVVNGGQVFVADGVYNFAGSRLIINKSLTLTGESEDGVILDGRSVGGGLGTVLVSADNVTLSNFTLYGADSGANNYGIKVQPNPAGYNANQRLYNFSINDVTVRGSTRAELDLNGVVGATITNFTADGRRVGDDSHESGGAGVQITDSADITLTGVTTLGNAWGSVAIYQTNAAGAYNGLTNNINIDAGENTFNEFLGLFVQSYSTLHPEIGQLNLTGFDYAVRNTGHRANGQQFTFFRTDLDDAADFALNIGAAETSSIEGWSGTDYTNTFTVVNGLAIGAAVRDVRSGGFINVGAGTYGGFGTAFGGPADLTITGAAGAIIDGSGLTGRIVDLRADGTTLSGFAIQGDGGGVAVSVSGRGVTVSNNVIDDVLTGVQTTTQYAAGNAVITGNTITADYGVSLQNTGNTVSGNTVNAAVEGVGLLRSANSLSGNTFNVAAGADALNYYGVATFAGLTTSDNTVAIEGGGLQGALDLAGAGGSVDAGAATYNETVTIRQGLTLAGAGMDQTFITGGMILTGAINDLILSGFTITGAGANNTVIRGVSSTVTNLTMDDVRVDAESVADRFGVIGGRFDGDISITNSEFLNIDNWAVFDTRSGSGAPGHGTDVTSFTFSGNLIDNVRGGITVRQNDGGTGSVTITNNIVRNIGDSTETSGGIFKIFNAGTVNFTDNDISDIGTNASLTSDGVAYGAALLMRGVGTLNVTDNTFTNVHMAVATEKNGFSAPTLTTFTGNTFNNVGYAFFMPSDALAGGSVVFGAGNAINSGADSIQHIVWRGGSLLDLTGVTFDGQLGSEMSLAALLDLEDMITHGVDVAGAGLATVVDGHLFVTEGSGVDAALRALALADSGDTLNLSAGTHTLTNTLFIQDDSISVAGQGQGQTILDASGHGGYGIRVHGDDVSLSGFTLNGSAAVTNAAYGIKVEAASGSGASGRNTGFSISDVTINGSRKTGLDLNSVTDALIDGVTVTGVIAGNGIAITDSAGVVVSNSTTSGNAWGGLALYQRNNFSDQQLTDITIDASNSFGETNGVYLQQYASALHEADNLIIEGFDFVVQNDQQDGGATSYMWFQRDLQDAIDFAVNVANTDASVAGGWTGSDFDGNFYVGVGQLNAGGELAMSIAAAVDATEAGNIVNVLAGDFTLNSTLNVDESIYLIGAGQDETHIDASGVSGYGIHVTAGGVLLDGFTLTGPAANAGSSYGIKVNPTGGSGAVLDTFWIRNVTIQGSGRAELDLNGVLNGWIENVTADGLGTAGAGIQITDSDTVLIRDSVTRNNGWGGVALYSANGFFDQRLANITIEAGNDFQEANGLFLQHYSPLHDGPENITVEGYDFVVQNDEYRAAEGAWIYFQRTLQDALDFAVNLDGATVDAAWVQTWETDDFGDTFHVGFGMLAGGGEQGLSIQTAFDQSADGDTVDIAAGDYAQTAVLDGVRTVIFDDVGVGVTDLTLTSGAAGSGVNGRVTATGDISIDGDITLNGNTSLTGQTVSLAGVEGSSANGQTLTVQADAISIGSAGAATALRNLMLFGDTTLTGSAYNAFGFSVSGATTLANDVSIAVSGPLVMGAVDGAHALSISAGGPATLGEVGAINALTGLDVAASTISTSGATTTGDQSYSGALTLNGDYTAGGSFTVDGATTLGGATSLEAASINMASVDGEEDLSLAATGAVILGAVGSTEALASLTASGAAITTSGAITTGAQSYAGAVTLDGDYAAGGDFSVNGATTLGGDVEVDASAITLGAVDGAHDLSLNADGSVSLGAVGAGEALASLTASGAAIITSGAVTTGAQSYAGAVTLDGDYAAGGGFSVNGATTLGGDVEVDASAITLGAVDGGHDLSLNADGSVSLGAVGAGEALASLTASGASITTAGTATTGAQSYTGALALNGDYAAGGGFSVNGATTLAGDVQIISQGGDVMLGLIDGAHGLTITADVGDVTLGPVGSAVAVDDLTVSGGVVTTAGAASTGVQSWSGDEVRLSGTFTTAGGDFTVSGPAILNGGTTITTSGGDASLGSVDGAVAGGQSFRLDAGAGSIELGSLGALARLGATVVRANSTVLNGDTYAANSLSFMGAGADATVRLTELLTTFNTVQSGDQAGAISITPHLIGTVDGQQGVVFLAGTGASAGDGDITLSDAGTGNLRLGLMTATGGDFSAETVMLAGDFTSTLSGDQVFSDDTLDTLGDVNVTVAGNERGPINAGGSVTINTGGSANGAITAGGPVNVTSGGNSNRTIVSGGAVTLTSTGGSVGGSVQTTGPVTINSAGTITGSYASGGGTIILNAGQPINVQVNGGVIQVNAPGGVVGGVFNQISTDARGTFVINGEAVIGTGSADARQILTDGFIAPVGGVVGPTGLIQLPVGLALALISPAGEGQGQRPAVLVNDVNRLGELLRLGYTAIVIQIDESGLLIEEELILADTEQQQAAGVH
jgi:filamentous hemagglutinin family protein